MNIFTATLSDGISVIALIYLSKHFILALEIKYSSLKELIKHSHMRFSSIPNPWYVRKLDYRVKHRNQHLVLGWNNTDVETLNIVH